MARREQLNALSAPVLRNPQARTRVLAGVRQGLDAGKAKAARQAEQQALSRAIQGIDDGEKFALSSARAAKAAFADSVARIYMYCIFAAFLALLATLMMPNLTIPRRAKSEKAMPAHGEL